MAELSPEAAAAVAAHEAETRRKASTAAHRRVVEYRLKMQAKERAAREADALTRTRRSRRLSVHLEKLKAKKQVRAGSPDPLRIVRENETFRNRAVALWLFRHDNNIRINVARVVSHKAFEGFILFLIFLSCVMLILDTPVRPGDSENLQQKAVMDNVDLVVTLLFTLEMVLKIIGLGFAFCGP